MGGYYPSKSLSVPLDVNALAVAGAVCGVTFVLIIVVIIFRKRIRKALGFASRAQATAAVTPCAISVQDPSNPTRQIIVFAPPDQALPYPLVPVSVNIGNQPAQLNNHWQHPATTTTHTITMTDANNSTRHTILVASSDQALPYPLLPAGFNIGNCTLQANNGLPLTHQTTQVNGNNSQCPENNGSFSTKPLDAQPPPYEETMK